MSALTDSLDESFPFASIDPATSSHDGLSPFPLAPPWTAARPHDRPRAEPGRALVLDAETSSRRQLCGDLAARGWHVTPVSDLADFQSALGARDADAPELVIAEYRVAGKTVSNLLRYVPRTLWTRLVIVTAYGSVASAVRAVQLGVSGYLVKPTRGDQVLRAAGFPAAPPAPDPGPRADDSEPYRTLDRAIWEYLTRAVEDAGTLSGAARLLGLHARSLRRMLAKYPPPR